MIDNIFINKFKNENYSVYSLINPYPANVETMVNS